ncbi:uncharacterized protein PITG_22608 [Phytophthora infestans T30-4]|uniref:Transposase n=1 Tax=Phytophthora infestans (strain T30-4) TaxID=403677 RepID=D0RML8_PHYIT|nr:uncharacterized protein PITG_22608 [Phytophthora infestans T30-4]EEY64840.1 hypothetical protein PITG_22608 [Phytophthora infestans T30-4]|eukprot:XP_002909712.1 hypothetical protein PITG_22608 [Phytophthora infestans T30-4]
MTYSTYASARSLGRGFRRFRTTGNVLKVKPRIRISRWTSHVCTLVPSTICSALRFNLKLAREVLTKRARKSLLRESREYAARLSPFYGGPGQLVFIDETSKDERWIL